MPQINAFEQSRNNSCHASAVQYFLSFLTAPTSWSECASDIFWFVTISWFTWADYKGHPWLIPQKFPVGINEQSQAFRELIDRGEMQRECGNAGTSCCSYISRGFSGIVQLLTCFLKKPFSGMRRERHLWGAEVRKVQGKPPCGCSFLLQLPLAWQWQWDSNLVEATQALQEQSY